MYVLLGHTESNMHVIFMHIHCYTYVNTYRYQFVHMIITNILNNLERH